MIRTASSALAAALLATACSSPEQANNSPVVNVDDLVIPPDEPTDMNAAENLAANNATGDNGSQIDLRGLSSADIAANKLDGELGCSFTPEGEETLLTAKGDAGSKAAAQGLVNVAGSVERITAPGGFNGITNGATFSGKGKTIRIKLTGPAIGGGESPPRVATLTYMRADGAERTFNGRWVCGP